MSLTECNVFFYSSTCEAYEDNTIGCVQAKREDFLYTVKGKITPEHRVRQKPYEVVAICNESDGQIQSVNCSGYTASLSKQYLIYNQIMLGRREFVQRIGKLIIFTRIMYLFMQMVVNMILPF